MSYSWRCLIVEVCLIADGCDIVHGCLIAEGCLTVEVVQSAIRVYGKAWKRNYNSLSTCL